MLQFDVLEFISGFHGNGPGRRTSHRYFNLSTDKAHKSFDVRNVLFTCQRSHCSAHRCFANEWNLFALYEGYSTVYEIHGIDAKQVFTTALVNDGIMRILCVSAGYVVIVGNFIVCYEITICKWA